MMDIIKSIILDFQETRLETGIPRRLHFQSVHGKATVCTGVRRSGKSTYMFQLIQRLLESGVPHQNILYLNFFDDRLHNLRRENLGLIAEAYYSIYPEKKNAGRGPYHARERRDVSSAEYRQELTPHRARATGFRYHGRRRHGMRVAWLRPRRRRNASGRGTYRELRGRTQRGKTRRIAGLAR